MKPSPADLAQGCREDFERLLAGMPPLIAHDLAIDAASAWAESHDEFDLLVGEIESLLLAPFESWLAVIEARHLAE